MAETEIGTVKLVKIEDEMRSSYLDYAMSVIVARALPDVRDGLKPVQRRILYTMHELGSRHTAPYKKSARIVGETMGKYHPHGDMAIYDAMVRMAQDFSLRYMLVDGQGNFGSVDNDPPAAMRYTETRMAEIAEEMLIDIDKETVDFAPNFDDTLKEPIVLPSRLPNLLINGASGIAVGMATNIPPHNLGEVCDGIIHLIENPEATVDELAEFIKGPDFPTAGIILGKEGIQNAYGTGYGRIVVRANVHLEETAKSGRLQLVVTELPFQTNKAALIEKIANLVKDRNIEGIADLRDESDREGMRVVIELKRDAVPNQVLNSLYKHTAMQSAFFVNMLALVDGQPRVLSLKAALQHYISFRREVIIRRSRFELQKARDRAHILEGLKIALDNLDRVINTIRRSQSAETARTNLMRNFHLSQIQAQAILDMQLRRLAALERQKINDEYAEVLKTIAYLEDLLANPRKRDYVILEEVRELKTKYGDRRRTQIREEEAAVFRAEDLIPHRQVVVTLSHRGYIKRLPSETYRLQRRGGRGISGMVTREQDAVHHLLITDTHDDLFFFTDRGKVFRLKCYEVPDTSRQAKGMPVINLISLEQRELVTAVVAVPPADIEREAFLVMATRRGEVKKTPLSAFALVRSNGLIAMDLEKEDELVSAKLARQQDDVILVTKKARALRFKVAPLRTASRTSGGVVGIRLAPDDAVVSMDIVQSDAELLVITANGFGKRTLLTQSEYMTKKRGGEGVRTFKVSQKTGEVAATRVVYPGDELMIISAEGIVIRVPVSGIARQGRDTQGVGVMKLGAKDRVVSVARLEETPPLRVAPAVSDRGAETGAKPSRTGSTNKRGAKRT